MAIVGVFLASGRLIEEVSALGYPSALENQLRAALAELPGTRDNWRYPASVLNSATDHALELVIGVLESLRDWQNEGRTPVEIHQPSKGLWVHKVADGWEMVYAPLALGVRFDAGLNPASIEVAFFADWYRAMRAALGEDWAGEDDYPMLIPGIGRIGGGGAPSGPPPFWTRHVLSREVIP